jgi:hypothetical protein
MDNLSGPSDPRDQDTVAKPADISGPGDPRDNVAVAAIAVGSSGPSDPRDQ